MIYLFEDNEKDLISILYKSIYGSNMIRNFRYCNGNGNLCKTTKDELNKHNDSIAVFMDTIPGNRDIIRIYNELKSLSLKSNNRVIVFPIVCSEYYFIKSILDKNVIEDYTGIDICISKKPYFKSPLIQSEEDRRFCKNFEKYCKLILKKNLHNCAKHTSLNNDKYGIYYKSDCLCSSELASCKILDIEAKSFDLVKQYPCFPKLYTVTNLVKFSERDIIQIHRRLVDEFNSMVDIYTNEDIANIHKYKHISYMM